MSSFISLILACGHIAIWKYDRKLANYNRRRFPARRSFRLAGWVKVFVWNRLVYRHWRTEMTYCTSHDARTEMKIFAEMSPIYFPIVWLSTEVWRNYADVRQPSGSRCPLWNAFFRPVCACVYRSITPLSELSNKSKNRLIRLRTDTVIFIIRDNYSTIDRPQMTSYSRPLRRCVTDEFFDEIFYSTKARIFHDDRNRFCRKLIDVYFLYEL